MPEMSRIRFAGICGIAAPAVTLSLIFLAIALSPWFRWSANALSDLGVGEAALVFNSGLMIGGILTAVLAAGLFASEKLNLRRAGALLLFISAVALFGIGTFSEAAGRIHFYFSVAFFVALPISLFVLGAGAIVGKSKTFGVFTFLIGVLAASPWVFSWTAVAVPETISATVASVWSVVQGVRLYIGKI
jgi:hypothetical membrane protein